MDFSTITFVSAFPVIHRKTDPVISILSLSVTATIHLNGNKNGNHITQRARQCKAHVGSSPRYQCQPGEQAGSCTCQHRWGTMPSLSLGECWGWHQPSPISHTMAGSGSAGLVLAKARKCTKMSLERQSSECSQFLLEPAVSEASVKRENSSNCENQKAPQTGAIALKARAAFSQ